MPAISFSGLASGLDSTSIVETLTRLERIPIDRLQTENSNFRSKQSILDNLSSALSDLKTSATSLETVGDFLSYKATLSDDDFGSITTSGDSVPGTYNINVTQIAKAQRTYSTTFADKTAALSGSDQTLTLTIDGTDTDITVPAGTTLEGMVGLINGSGAAASAGIVYDGTNYRLQVVGDDTGLANAITFTDTGLGLDLASGTVQAAQDATFTLDGVVTVTSADNTIDDALPGTTIELTAPTTGTETITIGPDSDAVKEKLQDFVDKYNAVFTIINAQVGEGKGQDTLNGDSTVRALENMLQDVISNPIPGMTTTAGDQMVLTVLGIQTSSDGSLTLDSDDLDTQLAANFAETAKYFAGDATTNTAGMSGLIEDLVDTFTNSVDGVIKTRRSGLDDRIASNDTRIASLEEYVAGFEEQLKRQFTALEQAMAGLQSQQGYLAQFLNG